VDGDLAADLLVTKNGVLEQGSAIGCGCDGGFGSVRGNEIFPHQWPRTSGINTMAKWSTTAYGGSLPDSPWVFVHNLGAKDLTRLLLGPFASETPPPRD
jgi:hypothetical protein